MTMNGMGWMFDTVAETYDKFRPGYVPELYKMIFDYISLDNSCKLVEIGSGSGQATLPFLKTGCNITAVEPGEHFSKICKDKFREYSNLEIITNKFENLEFQNDTYNLVYSATAFHWVPEEIGYSKVFSMLKKGGVFARFANNPYRDKSKLELSKEIDELYDKYYYTFHNKKKPKLKEFTVEQAEERARIAGKYGFTDIKYALFTRIRTFTAKEYAGLLGTYSDHIAIEESIRKEFFGKIEEAINKYGGTIDIYDTMDLELARKG